MPVVQHGTDSLSREIPLPAAGTWVKLRNLAATWVDGQLQVTPQYCTHDLNTLPHDCSGVCNHHVHSQGLIGQILIKHTERPLLQCTCLSEKCALLWNLSFGVSLLDFHLRGISHTPTDRPILDVLC